MLVGSMEKGWLCNYLLSFNLNSSSGLPEQDLLSSTSVWPTVCRHERLYKSVSTYKPFLFTFSSWLRPTAVRIRPTTTQDTVTFRRFQRTIIQAGSQLRYKVDATQSAPTAVAANGVTQAPPSAVPPKSSLLLSTRFIRPPPRSMHCSTATAEPLFPVFCKVQLHYSSLRPDFLGKTPFHDRRWSGRRTLKPHNAWVSYPGPYKYISTRKQIKEERAGGWSCSIKSSFIEIYNEEPHRSSREEGVSNVSIIVKTRRPYHWGGSWVNVRNAAKSWSTSPLIDIPQSTRIFRLASQVHQSAGTYFMTSPALRTLTSRRPPQMIMAVLVFTNEYSRLTPPSERSMRSSL